MHTARMVSVYKLKYSKSEYLKILKRIALSDNTDSIILLIIESTLLLVIIVNESKLL